MKLLKFKDNKTNVKTRKTLMGGIENTSISIVISLIIIQIKKSTNLSSHYVKTIDLSLKHEQGKYMRMRVYVYIYIHQFILKYIQSVIHGKFSISIQSSITVPWKPWPRFNLPLLCDKTYPFRFATRAVSYAQKIHLLGVATSSIFIWSFKKIISFLGFKYTLKCFLLFLFFRTFFLVKFVIWR